MYTGVDLLLRSGFREYEEEKLRFPACCRQKNAIFYLIFTEPRAHHKVHLYSLAFYPYMFAAMILKPR